MNTRFYRRERAIELMKKGWKQVQIAEALGVSQAAVSQWKQRFEEGGAAGLPDRPIPGAPARLNRAQQEQLKRWVDQGAAVYGFEGDFWTHARVSRVLAEQFSISLSPKQCGRILKKLDYTRQKPQLHSKAQSAEKVQAWKEEILPELKKSPGT